MATQLESVLADARFKAFLDELRRERVLPASATPEVVDLVLLATSRFLRHFGDDASNSTPPSASPATDEPKAESTPNQEESAWINMESVDSAKAEGNAHFRASEWLPAALAYGRALAVCPTCGPRAVLLANRAAALIKAGHLAEAEKDASLATRLQPTYGKAWAQLGAALAPQGKARLARSALSRALELDGSLTTAAEQLRALG
jgi:tetratricopeptide (TPR) repeat protein